MASDDNVRVEKIKNKWNERSKSDELDQLFEGTGYITIGYYRSGDETVGASVLNMTQRLAEISEISSHSHVLDLGCGKGRPVLDIAVQTGCSVVGVDLAEGHIALAIQSAGEYRKEKKADLKAEFHVASYFELPEAVMSQRFSHVVMQTSMFYAHNRIDELFSQITKLLKPGGRFIATDFVRVAEVAELTKFMEYNSMPVILSLDEIQAAFLRHGLEYIGGENLDSHCIKCNAAKRKRLIELKLGVGDPEFFKNREQSVKEKKVSFQVITAQKCINV